VGAHGALVVFDLHVLERSDLNDSGVVDQYVDVPKMLLRRLNDLLDLFSVGYVAGYGKNFGASLP
jgi:hypothetical protein